MRTQVTKGWKNGWCLAWLGVTIGLAASSLGMAQDIPPQIRITQPADGASVELGASVTIQAVAEDADGYASYAEFYANGVSIDHSQILFFRAPDPGTPIYHEATWRPDKTGQFDLTAVAVDDQGTKGISSKVSITVKPASDNLPRITDIWLDKAEVVVDCLVPKGLQKLTLESKPRVGSGGWTPRAVQRLDGTGGSVTFRVKQSAELEILRVRADAQDALPASFYQGTTNFSGQGSAYDPSTVSRGGVYDLVAPGKEANGTPSATRTVVESDIWQRNGDTLYFFNQYRGLQIIDLKNVDAPVIKYSLDLPASGEQMYQLDDHHVVLLAQSRYNSTNGVQSEVIVVDVSGAPQIVSRVPVTGTILESRLVGTALYVVSQYYRQVPIPPKDPSSGGAVSTSWEWGSLVASIDLSNPQAAIARSPIWLAGYGNVINATDRFLFACVQDPVDYWQSLIHIIDISSPDGVMQDLATLKPAGTISSKFRLNLSGDIFTVISEQWNRLGGVASQRVSVLQTFTLATPAQPLPLGKLELGHGEGLYATRFDGERVYVVTFLRVDPLWVVDLRDPEHPKISGELQVPGWSTFIYPMGDRLVTIGVDNTNSWKVAVSLFDVADPTKPGLLAKVPLGESSSWSEANSDERALSVLPESGLVMVPYQSWGTNGYASQVQLIDLSRDNLKARGVITHSIQPRRATVYSERVLSISGRELLTVNIVDRDHPLVTSDLELSWSVTQVLASGNYLIEVANDFDWQSLPKPMLHVASKFSPNNLQYTYQFTNGYSVLGSTISQGKLYVLQGNQTYWYWPVVDVGSNGTQNDGPVGKAIVSVFDLASLPNLQLTGQTTFNTTNMITGTFTPVWPSNNLLVWASSGGGIRPYLWRGILAVDYFYPWWGGMGGRLLAFDVSQSSAPRFVSETSLQGTNSWWSFSQPQSAPGLVYLSHQGSEFLPDVTPSWYQKPAPVISKNGDGTLETNYPPVGIWVTKYYLDVVDYADPTTPTVRPPINLPGELVGLSQNGALVYTLGTHWKTDGTSDGGDYLDVGAYDGVSVALVDSLRLTNSWPRPIVLPSGKILLVQTVGADSAIQTWVLTGTARFGQLGSLKLAGQLSGWRAMNQLLVVQGYDKIDLFNLTTPESLVYLNSGMPPGWTYPDLANSDGDLTGGVWMPLGDYGLFSIPASTQP
jgi:hypothetical protein